MVTVVTVFKGAVAVSKQLSQLSRTVTERIDGMKNVQISQELFTQLLRFHLIGDESCGKNIKQSLEQKLDRMVLRDLYGKSKTAPTEGRTRTGKKRIFRQTWSA